MTRSFSRINAEIEGLKTQVSLAGSSSGEGKTYEYLTPGGQYIKKKWGDPDRVWIKGYPQDLAPESRRDKGKNSRSDWAPSTGRIPEGHRIHQGAYDVH